MFTHKNSEHINGLAEQARQILHPEESDGLVSQAGVLAQRGLEGLREGSQELRKQAQRVSEKTLIQIREEPVKAMLVAVATGAVLMAVFGLLGRSRRAASKAD